ncbi:cephalosporin c regulator 1 protein [Rutstroemia sp. NJR-2017a BBW]|nr:cephalosporin c regulator 1 protein [Rutstroemia sp. NJR-2017a BBW]
MDPPQWFEQNANAQHKFDTGLSQMTPEDMVMHSASQLQNPRGYDIEHSMNGVPGHSMQSYHSEIQYRHENGRQSIPMDNFAPAYGDGDSQVLEGRSDEQDDADSLGGANGATKKPSKSSAANELEMRQLFQSNKHRSLQDVASELLQNERGPQSERQRQVFAMLWINKVCDKGTGSVPRGRVYANYVSRCGTEKVTVLNPASFGKLVRVLFPGLKTRRLGVRGESKYHYVNFSLKDDQPQLHETQSSQTINNFNDTSFTQSFNQSMNSQMHYPADKYPLDRAPFPSPTIPQETEQSMQRSQGFIRPHSLYTQPVVNKLSDLECTTKTPQVLHFAPIGDSAMQDYGPITLPKIQQFLPAGTDPDSALALSALYRSHCTSLVEQVVPKVVLDTLRNISDRLVSHIQSSFHGQPAHVIEAKVGPATTFASLLDKELRVNLTAHAAANMLSNPYNRDQMYEDFITMVSIRKVAESVPTRGMDDVVNLFINELRDLLDPTSEVSWEVESRTPFGEMAQRMGRQRQASVHADATTENVLDRWVNLLLSLPAKFPYATHAEIVWCVQKIGTAVMRDLTIAQGKSFGAWWVTKCWIDEMIAFMAEQGGFMQRDNIQSPLGDGSRPPATSRRTSQQGNRYSTGNDEFLGRGLNNDRSMPASQPMDVAREAAMNAAAGHDDSGIGMRTPDDEFAMGKYGFVQEDVHATMEPSALNHSLPQTSMA